MDRPCTNIAYKFTSDPRIFRTSIFPAEIIASDLLRLPPAKFKMVYHRSNLVLVIAQNKASSDFAYSLGRDVRELG